MTKLTLALFTLMLIITLVGCKKENSNTHQSIGTIYFGGPLSGDGCDWLIQLADGRNYHPLALGSDYLTNGQKVIVNYSPTSDTFRCGWTEKLPIIKINVIQKM
jgi:hypothetical protein